MDKSEEQARQGLPLNTAISPKHHSKPLAKMPVVSIETRAKMTKTEFVAMVLARGFSLNRWEAANLRDSCLNSTIPSISKKFGVEVHRKSERVPTFAGKHAEAMRYWLEPSAQKRVLAELARALHQRGVFESVSLACQFVSGVLQ